MSMSSEEFARQLAAMGIDINDLGEAAKQRGDIQLEQIKKTYKLGQDQLSNAYKIASMQSGNTRAQIEAVRDAAREQTALAREEMERVGIPRVEIERFTAETNREIARGELTYKNAALEEDRRQFGQTLEEKQREFGLTFGLDERKFAEDTRRYGLDFALKEAGLTGMYNNMPTLDKQKFEESVRQFGLNYGLQVAQFGAQLGSQQDTYFQARRFQGTDLPRLIGGAAAQTQPVYGGPTPQISTLGARLSGADPAAVGGGPGQMQDAAIPGVLGLPGTPEDDRAKQIAAITKAVPPSPYDGLNEQDAAALRLVGSIYAKGGQGVARGELERLQASGRKGYMDSAGRLLGYDPKEFDASYAAYAPTQGSSRSA